MRRVNELTIELRPFGNSCSLDCPFCYQRISTYSKFLDPDIVFKLLDTLMFDFIKNRIQIIKIVFHGGEPLLDDGIWLREFLIGSHKHVGKYLKNGINIQFSCHTSGRHYISDELLSFQNISFALTHMGSPSFSEYYNLSDNKDIYHDNILRLSKCGLLNCLIIPITRFHTKHISELIPLLLNYKNVHKKLLPVFKGISPFDPNLYLLDTDFINFLDLLRREIINNNKDISLLKDVEPFDRLTGNFRISTQDCRFSLSCPFHSRRMMSFCIDSDSTIYPCNRFAGISKFGVNYKDFIFSYSLGKNSFLNKNILSILKQKCINCSIKNLCTQTGGCPFLGVMEDGSYFDHTCEIENSFLINKRY